MRTCVNQDSPGANLHPGGAGNAIVQAEHHNRETTGQKVILSCIKMDTAIYRLFKVAPATFGHSPRSVLGSFVWLPIVQLNTEWLRVFSRGLVGSAKHL